MNQTLQGDCLELMKDIPDKSIDLVVIDPPYNINKASWDRFESNSQYISFMGRAISEFERVLKPNGSFYFFHNDFMQIVDLQVWIKSNTKFIFKSLITVNKEEGIFVNKRYPNNQFKKYIHNSEYLLFYTFFDEEGRNDNVLKYFDSLLRATGLNKTSIKKKVHGADHCFRVSDSNFALPTADAYQEITKLIKTDFKVLPLSFFKNTFNKDIGLDDTWTFNFKQQKRLGHITPKPVKLIEKIILTSSKEGDVVLDSFAGSGTTAIACINTNRKYIAIEKEPEYIDIITRRISQHSCK